MTACDDSYMNTTHTITVNGVTGTRVEVVRPVRRNADGSKTLISFIKGARVSTKWVSTSRIEVA